MVAFFGGVGPGIDGNKGQSRDTREVVATVNGDPIARGELDTVVAQMRLGSQSDLRAQEEGRGQALEMLVAQKAFEQAARKAGLEVSNQELSTEVEKRIEQTTAEHVGGLAGAAKDSAVAEITADIKGNKDQIREQMLSQKFAEQLGSKVKEEDRHPRHILIKVRDPKAKLAPGAKPEGRPDAEAKALAESVLKQAQAKGADFAALAKKYGEDGTKANGGDLDWGPKGRMVPDFDKAVFSMKPGEVRGPIKTQFGYHIIKLEAIRPSTTAKNQAVQKYAEEQKNLAKVTVKDPQIHADYLLAQARTMWSKPKEQQAKKDEALKLLEGVVRKDSTNAAALVTLAGLYSEKHTSAPKDKALLAKAVSYNEKAVAAAESPSLQAALGRLYTEAGQKDKALKALEKASQIAYSDVGVRNQLKSQFEALGRKDLAAKEDKQIKELSRNAGPGQSFTVGGNGGGQPIHIPSGR
jgi:tetratricopeptide (TPR) repeat protein